MFWYHFVVKTSVEIFLVKLTRQETLAGVHLKGLLLRVNQQIIISKQAVFVVVLILLHSL